MAHAHFPTTRTFHSRCMAACIQPASSPHRHFKLNRGQIRSSRFTPIISHHPIFFQKDPISFCSAMEAPDSKKRSLAVTGTTAADSDSGLPDDLIVDILSCTPVKLICHFKCVSPSWRNLISHPDNRKKLPQTLTGFFYFDDSNSYQFVSLAEPPRSTSLFAFLPAKTGGEALDCCNGLVLLKSPIDSGSASEPHASYVVCNPTTKKWTTVPESI